MCSPTEPDGVITSWLWEPVSSSGGGGGGGGATQQQQQQQRLGVGVDLDRTVERMVKSRFEAVAAAAGAAAAAMTTTETGNEDALVGEYVEVASTVRFGALVLVPAGPRVLMGAVGDDPVEVEVVLGAFARALAGVVLGDEAKVGFLTPAAIKAAEAKVALLVSEMFCAGAVERMDVPAVVRFVQRVPPAPPAKR